ncbi:hypothetical protein [uncultured Brevibacterium sp.]|uniref:hypothetical protein n=1 Tax=uncultured Brevibacterium sp. TaxID=189678 RepID=UPI0025CD324B|nr:hypothetical protein [uncultured Brevibacterium sp.]
MGIRYRAFPLRTDLDLMYARANPLECAHALDHREHEWEHTAPGTPRIGELYLDKAWRQLQWYFSESPPIPDELRGPVAAHSLARPGLLLLSGDVSFVGTDYGWDPYLGVVPAPYVRIAADDYATVDENDLFERGEEYRAGDGEYCRQYFVHLRDTTRRWSDEGFGALYYIG